MKEPSDDERPIMDEGNLKAVLRATGRPLRDAQEVLEENGIPWSVVYEGEEQGYRLSVPAERGEEAMRVLAATESQRLLRWIFGLGSRRPVLCPKCGSRDHSRNRRGLVVLAGAATFTFIISLTIMGVARLPLAIFFSVFCAVGLSPFVGWYHQKHSGERTCRGCGAQFRV